MAESKYLQVTPQYKAMSLDERLRHVALYRPEYEKQQEQYNKLLEDGVVLDQLKNSEVDSDLYREYSNWREGVNNQLDSLLNTGVLDSNAVMQLRRDYLNNFRPKEDLVRLRNALVQRQASEYSPYTLFDKDFSKVSINDMTPDANYRTYRLDDIEKNAFSKLSERYIQTGVPSDPQNDVEELLSEIDTDGLSADQIESIRGSISSGYMKAQRTVDEYNLQQERARKQDDYQKLQMDRLRKTIDGDTSDDVVNPFNPTKKNPAAGKEPFKVINGNAGDQIPIYKLTDKGKDYYFVMRGKDPVLIDNSIIGEDGSVDYTSFYNTVYGDPKASYYDGREYFVGTDGKINSNIGNYTQRNEFMIHSSDELKKFLQNNPEYAGTLLQVAKERYDIKDLFNSDLLNFRDISVRVYEPNNNGAYPKSKVTVSLKEKSGRNDSFTLIDGLVPTGEKTPETPASSTNPTGAQNTPAPQGVGNMVIG